MINYSETQYLLFASGRPAAGQAGWPNSNWPEASRRPAGLRQAGLIINILIIALVHLREMRLLSRNILHGRGVGSKSRVRVLRPPKTLGAFDPQNTCRNCSLESLFLALGMRSVYRNSVFRGSTN